MRRVLRKLTVGQLERIYRVFKNRCQYYSFESITSWTNRSMLF